MPFYFRKECPLNSGYLSLSVKLAQTINVGTTYRLDVGDQFTLRCGNAALVLHKDGSIEFCGKQLLLHTSDVMQLIGSGIDMNPDGGTAMTADDIAPLLPRRF
ncbi:rhs-family domain protein [Shigella flexneri SFJ17B]|nr:rhs-family domain protein [Shigella flexneri SFJ17B]